MVKNPKILKRFEFDLIRRSRHGYNHNVKIANELLRLAIKLGVFPPKNRLDGIEVDIKFAKAMNSVR